MFTISRNGDAQAAQTVQFATSDSGVGGAFATAGTDYNALSGTLTFNQTDLSKTITVTTIDDALFEQNEAFQVSLSNATGGATIGTASATGTINNNALAGNDPAPIFNVSGASLTEGGVMTFTVTRTGNAQAAQTVAFGTSSGTAEIGRAHV